MTNELWLAEEEKRYTTDTPMRKNSRQLWLAEEEKRYTTEADDPARTESCGLLKKRRDIQPTYRPVL